MMKTLGIERGAYIAVCKISVASEKVSR